MATKFKNITFGTDMLTAEEINTALSGKQTQIDAINTSLASKQAALTAGTGITITDGVISATGSGSGSSSSGSASSISYIPGYYSNGSFYLLWDNTNNTVNTETLVTPNADKMYYDYTSGCFYTYSTSSASYVQSPFISKKYVDDKFADVSSGLVNLASYARGIVMDN